MDSVLRLEIQFLKNLRRHVDGLNGIGAMDIMILISSVLFRFHVKGRHFGEWDETGSEKDQKTKHPQSVREND